MNPFLSKELATEHIRDLHDAARGTRIRVRKDTKPARDVTSRITVRRFAERDIDSVRLLAALDSKPMPTGGVLVAEQDGEVVAALPLDSGQALADPFKPTAHLVALLKVRAAQIHASERTPLISWSRFHMPRGRLAA
jgi:hypothetical protein